MAVILMGYWGVKSYENDEADTALDAGFDRVHGARFVELMDDRNPLSYEQVLSQLANDKTLEASLTWLAEQYGDDPNQWDNLVRVAYVGVVVRHRECRVAIPGEVRAQAKAWIEAEDLDWDEPTMRRLRRGEEITLLSNS